jgi:PAS domain S-box-containing protein
MDLFKVSGKNQSPLWEVSPDLLGITDSQGIWLEINPAWTETLGWPAERILGQTSRWLLHSDDLIQRRLDVARMMRGAKGEYFEYRFLTSAGAYRIISWTVVPAGEHFYCVGRDITDDRARETALRDSVDFARLALSAVSGVGVWTYEAASDRFFCDAGVSELYGIDPQEGAKGILRGDFLANVHPEDRAPLRATMAGGLLRSGDLELEYRICHPDGSTRWVLSRGHTYFDENDVPIRRTGVGIDTTRQRQLEQQLRQSQKMEALGQLTGGIAHDFNNMLQGVMGPLEMLRMRLGGSVDEVVARYLDMALGSTRRAATLTRRQPLSPQSVDVRSQVQAMADILQRTIGEKLTLVLDIAPTACHARCDANQLDNALLNLAINARDAMPEAGTLAISCSLVDIDAGQAIEHGKQPGSYTCLAVHDTGVGMPPSVINQAFNPFFTTKPIGQGTGLGLSMVYGFANQSGGFVTIDSRIGDGTTVSIYLPASDGVPGEIAPPLPLSSIKHSKTATVLVVEDEPAVLAMLSEVFGEAGYQVLTGSNGVDAQDHLKADSPIDLLITDIGLPGMNGRQVAEIARNIFPRLPVLFMTGYAELAAVTDGFLEPGMELIAKPFGIKDILTRVQQLLEKL